MGITPEGLQLIKSWEGCRLCAYPDPASGGAPWTIGYGHTGPEVHQGLAISQQQAEAWLAADIAKLFDFGQQVRSGQRHLFEESSDQ